MLRDIYNYDVVTAQYKRRYTPDHGVWMAYGVNKGGVYAVELCTDAVTLSEYAFRAFKSREDIEGVEYIIARDELDAFMKARKMEENK